MTMRPCPRCRKANHYARQECALCGIDMSHGKLSPEWRYLPLAGIYQHVTTGELRARGSSLGIAEQLPDDCTLATLNDDAAGKTRDSRGLTSAPPLSR